MNEESRHQLAPASPTVPGQLIDAHVHLFTYGLFQEYVNAHPDANPVFRQAVKDRRFGRQQDLLPDMTPEQTARWYVERLKAAGVAKALLVSVVPDSQWTREFVTATKGHIHALAYIDPRTPDAAELIEREMAFGFRGAKLLPVNNSYRLSDPVCRPFLEKAASLRASMIVHYGVTVDPAGDLRYADPIDLSPVARDYPEITWVIAHFGAGWLDSVLRLAYQCENICVDSSGTNNWLDYHIPPMSLADVFRQCLVSLGPERVLFGTDSNTVTPYREWILHTQRRILEEIGLSEHDLDAVMRGNAVRIFCLDE